MQPCFYNLKIFKGQRYKKLNNKELINHILIDKKKLKIDVVNKFYKSKIDG